MVAGDGLQGLETATTVRVRDGESLVTDGPFAETKEMLAGYYLIDVPDLDAALAWAAKIPSVGYGSVEVRPVMVFDQGPEGGRDRARFEPEAVSRERARRIAGPSGRKVRRSWRR